MQRRAQPLVIAHRGASAYRPENTLAAFELAIEQRADMIETDLHLSRDGAIVVRHDADLAGIGLRGEIRETDLARIRALDAGAGERVPTLDEVLDRFGAAIPFNLELKIGAGGAYAGLEAAVLRTVEARGLLASTLFSTFDDGVLATLRALSSRARLAVLVSRENPDAALARAYAVGAEAINPWFGIASAARIEAAHAAGLAVYPYTVDAPADLRRFLELGVEGIFTNHPDRLRELIGTARASQRGV